MKKLFLVFCRKIGRKSPIRDEKPIVKNCSQIFLKIAKMKNLKFKEKPNLLKCMLLNEINVKINNVSN